MFKPPIDLDGLYRDFFHAIGEDRGDEHRLHGSDLGGCDYATHLRLRNEPRLPFDDDTLHRFFMGHMVEKYVAGAFNGRIHTLGGEVEHKGIVGHLDIEIDDLCIIDISTTRAKEAKPQYGHTLKTAFYADAKGYDCFAEWVFRVGYGGKILPPVAYWFETVQFLGTIDERIRALQAIEFDGVVPPIEPPAQMEWNGTKFVPTGALETWRCTKYCNAVCPRNELAKDLVGVSF